MPRRTSRRRSSRPAALTPNDPRKRLEYVVKTYWPKHGRVVSDVIQAAANTVGMEGQGQEYGELMHGLLMSRADEASSDEIKADALASLKKTIALFPTRHEADFTFPWLARELSKLWNAAVRKEATFDDYEQAQRHARRSLNAIARWAKAERKDINKVSLAEAFEAIKEFEVDSSETPQGAIIYTYADGWTAQELRQREELEAEGEVMQHCVGGYCGPVSRHETHIISIRDAKGQPHITIEWKPPKTTMVTPPTPWPMRLDYDNRPGEVMWKAYKADGLLGLITIARDPANYDSEFASQLLRNGTTAQIFGKQNEPPAEKYRPRVWELYGAIFDTEPMGMALSYAPKKSYSFKGRHVSNVAFDAGMTPEDVFAGVDFGGATIRGVAFTSFDMSDCSFEECVIEHSTFSGCDLARALFDRAKLYSVRFTGKLLKDVSFDGAEMHDVDFDFRDWNRYSERGLVDVTFVDVIPDEETLKRLWRQMGDAQFRDTFHRTWVGGEGFVDLVWSPYARDYVRPEELEEDLAADEESVYDDGEEN